MDRFSAQGLIYQQIFQLLEKSTGLHCSSSSQWLGLIKCILGGGMATVVLRTVCALLFGIKTQGLIPLLCPSPSTVPAHLSMAKQLSESKKSQSAHQMKSKGR